MRCFKYNFIKIMTALIFVLLLGTTAYASENKLDIYTFGDNGNPDTRVSVQIIGEELTMVLPSAVKPESLTLFWGWENSSQIYMEGDLKKEIFISGKRINLNDFCADSNYKLKFLNGEEAYTVRFLFSENLPSLFLVSDNPEEKGREWVEASEDKSNKATGRMALLKEDGTLVHQGALTQIKGRGNSTWIGKKKPYQIKTDTKVDLLQTGNPDNKSKTWVLLANYLDLSLMNNSIALGLGNAMGMETNIENTHIDLYYDGQYRGSYLLSEKVEVGDGRVNITDLEEINEEENDGTDIEELPIGNSTTENGAFFTYCENMKSPEDVSGGYLLEMDYEYRALEEVCYFRTTRGQYVVVKSPEYASKEEMNYIASLYQEYEDAVYNGGVNPETGKAYTDYVDGESVACYYIMNEFTKARDFFSSSAYLYKDSGDGKMKMGPLWDYDLGFGKSRYEENTQEPSYGLSVYNTAFGEKLLQIPSFRELLASIYEEELYPLVKELEIEEERLRASALCNAHMWHQGQDWEEDVQTLRTFINERAWYLRDTFSYLAENTSYKKGRYGDVLENDWYLEAVTTATDKGYMNGVSDNFFDPYAKVRRSETAQVLFNMSGAKAMSFKKQFTDVNEGDWFASAVNWALKKGVMSGITKESFNPNQYITREEFVMALYRYAGKPRANGNLLGFADSGDVSADARNAVRWAVEKNILQGDSNLCLNPKGYITRAELATMLIRYK